MPSVIKDGVGLLPCPPAFGPPWRGWRSAATRGKFKRSCGIESPSMTLGGICELCPVAEALKHQQGIDVWQEVQKY